MLQTPGENAQVQDATIPLSHRQGAGCHSGASMPKMTPVIEDFTPKWGVISNHILARTSFLRYVHLHLGRLVNTTTPRTAARELK